MSFATSLFDEASPSALDLPEVAEWTGDDRFLTRAIPDGWMTTWNAPTCERCWVDRKGMQQPVRVHDARQDAAICAFCGRPTWARIFTRADPRLVPYPDIEPAG